MKKFKASLTIEASFIMPLVFMVFLAVIYITFYFHDKNIISGAAWETAVVMAGQKRLGDQNVTAEECFRERLGGKLIFFDQTEVKMQTEEDNVVIVAQGQRNSMGISAEVKAAATSPEKYIRAIRKAENIIQEIKK